MKASLNIVLVVLVLLAVGVIKNIFGLEGPCKKIERSGATQEQVNACNYVMGAGY